MKTVKVNVIVAFIVVAFSLSSLAQSQTEAIETAKKLNIAIFIIILSFCLAMN